MAHQQPQTAQLQSQIEIPVHIRYTHLNAHVPVAPLKLTNDPYADISQLILSIDDEIITCGKAQNHDLEKENAFADLLKGQFQAIRQKHFGGKPWPKAYDVEERMNVEFKDGQLLYNEYILRGSLSQLNDFNNAEVVTNFFEEAWDTYTDLFKCIRSRLLPLPPSIWWEICSYFIRWGVTRQNNKLLSSCNQGPWSDDECRSLLCSKSFSQSSHPFSLYTHLSYTKLLAHARRYSDALQTLEVIKPHHLPQFSKCFEALYTLFYVVAVSHFFNEQYLRSTATLETILLFSQKNRKYVPFNSQNYHLNTLVEQLTCMLCICYAFLEEEPKGPLVELFRMITIRGRDKTVRVNVMTYHNKLRQHDIKSAMRLYDNFRPSYCAEERSIIERRLSSLLTPSIFSLLQHYDQANFTTSCRAVYLNEKELRNTLQVHTREQVAAKTDSLVEALNTHARRYRAEINGNRIIMKGDTSDEKQSHGAWTALNDEVQWLRKKVDEL